MSSHVSFYLFKSVLTGKARELASTFVNSLVNAAADAPTGAGSTARARPWGASAAAQMARARRRPRGIAWDAVRATKCCSASQPVVCCEHAALPAAEQLCAQSANTPCSAIAAGRPGESSGRAAHSTRSVERAAFLEG